MLRHEKYIKVKRGKSATYYTVQFFYKDKKGVKTQYSKTFTSTDYETEKQCLDAACNHRNIKRVELTSGKMPGSEKKTVDEVFNEYIVVKKVPLSTQIAIKSLYRLHIQPDYGYRALNTITALDVTECLNDMIYEYSNGCISRTMSLWRKIFKMGMIDGSVGSSPLDLIDIPESKLPYKQRDQVLNLEDFNKLCDYLNTHGIDDNSKYNYKVMACALKLMYYTGMRPQEAFAINRKDINFDSKEITIQSSIGATDKKIASVIDTKTKKSVRQLSITPSIEMILRMAMSMSDHDLVFSMRNGEPFPITYLTAAIHSICVKKGYNFHMYQLRHNFATVLNNNGTDIRTIMELMGHVSGVTTIGYERSDDEKKNEAIKLVEIGRKEASKDDNKA